MKRLTAKSCSETRSYSFPYAHLVAWMRPRIMHDQICRHAPSKQRRNNTGAEHIINKESNIRISRHDVISKCSHTIWNPKQNLLLLNMWVFHHPLPFTCAFFGIVLSSFMSKLP